MNTEHSKTCTPHFTPMIDNNYDADNISQRIEEITTKIGNLEERTKVYTEECRQFTDNYKDAFETVLNQLEYVENSRKNFTKI